MKASVKNYRESFSCLPASSEELYFLRKYLKKGSSIYLHKKTGVVSSELKRSAEDILSYWSKKIFKSKNRNDYSAFYPFARARLYYVTRTFIDRLMKKIKKNWTVCDFGTGQGVLPELLKRECPNLKVFCTEGSRSLVNILKRKKQNVFFANLSSGSMPKIKVDCGFLTWTLCNCIKPYSVLLGIRKNIKHNGFLIIADSSRILVPFKKSLHDLLPNKHPADIHPYFFSAKSLTALLKCAGFQKVYCNRFFDSDILLIIAKKINLPSDRHKIICDSPKDVKKFFILLNKNSQIFRKYPNKI